MAQLSVTINIPDAYASTINAWRLKQKKADGTLVYPTAADLLKAWLRERAREVIAAESQNEIT